MFWAATGWAMTVYTYVCRTRELASLTRDSCRQDITYADELASLAREVGRLLRSPLSPFSLVLQLKSSFNETKLYYALRGRKRLSVRWAKENSKKEVDDCDNSCNIYT